MHTPKPKSLRMKYLFFVAVVIGTFSGTSMTAKAQTSVHVQSVTSKDKPKISLKFIEDVVITPEKNNGDVAINAPATTYTPVAGTSVANKAMGSIEDCSALQFKYGMLMNREVESFTNMQLYSFLDDWWATRYKYGGTDRKGIDCSAFTGRLLLDVYGITVPRTAHEQYAAAEKVDREDLREGDLVFFNTRGGVSHVGVYLGDNYFAHSSVKSGVTISSLTDDYYSRKFIGGRRVEAVNN